MQHFKSGVIRVKCTSTVFPTRLSKGPSMSNEAILRGESTDMPLEQIFWQDNLKEDAKSGVAATQQSNSLLLTALLFISQSLFAFSFSIFSFGPRLGMPWAANSLLSVFILYFTVQINRIKTNNFVVPITFPLRLSLPSSCTGAGLLNRIWRIKLTYVRMTIAQKTIKSTLKQQTLDRSL